MPDITFEGTLQAEQPDTTLEPLQANTEKDLKVTLDGETVTVTGTQADALTDAELRAADVAVTLDGETVTVTGTQTDGLTDAELRASPVEVDLGRELTERLLAKSPQDGYRLWLDVADASHIYILEAPAGTASSATGFQGIRVTLVSGTPVGAVEVNTAGTLTFDNRTSDGNWAA